MKVKVLLVTGVLLMTMVFGGCSTDETNNHHEDEEASSAVEHVHEEVGHVHGDYEWIGEFELEAGTYLFHFGESQDETMDVGFIKMGDNITDLEHHASHLMAVEKEFIKQDSVFEAKPDFAYTLEMNEDHGHIHFTIEEDGTYAIVTEHLPSENTMQIFNKDRVEILPIAEHEEAGHSH